VPTRRQALHERRQDLLDALRVLLVPLVLGVHHEAGVDDFSFGHERQDGDLRFFPPVLRAERHDAALLGRADFVTDVDPEAFEQRR
jgi:hypothetical protein